MKKILLLTLFLLNINYFCYSQAENRRNNIEAIQIAYLTRDLSLSVEEAQKFWPVYNEYRDELLAVRKEVRNDEVLFEEKVLNIRKKYKTDFKKVLGTDQRVNQVFVAEKSFRELLRKELMKRRGNKQNLPD
ncbi:MAG: hypothetical protein LH478_02165 [Chitinophagaceae bacterium]|nr:hypothetical protein [Chitinophagaceae bacterium]